MKHNYTEEYLKSRVHAYSGAKDIIIFNETPYVTSDSMQKTFDVFYDLVKPLDHFYLIINLTEAKRPNAEVRKLITIKFEPIKDKMRYTAIYTGKNKIINVMVAFMMARLNLPEYSVNTTLEQAIRSIEKYRLQNNGVY